MRVERLEGRWACLAAEGYERQCESALPRILERHGRLYVCEGDPRRALFAANEWHEPTRVTFSSIAQAARALRSLQRSWCSVETQPGLYRRTALVQQRLPHVSARPLRFPDLAPATPLGSYTLIEPGVLLCSARCSSPFPNGELQFVEDREGPPNRAYRKLWEALTVLGRRPAPGDRCLDVGASPGGWTWVVARCGASVLAVDRSPLDPKVAELAGVSFETGSGFAFQPNDHSFDWIFSDMACYPRRLWSWTERWLRSGAVSNLVLTVKLQGQGDQESLDRFLAVPNGRLLHLHHNKHELTFLWPASP